MYAGEWRVEQRTIDVLAVLGGVGTSASAEAELVIGHEVGPLVVLVVFTKSVAVDKTAD